MIQAKQYLRDGRTRIPIKEATSRVMSANKAGDAKPELLLRKALWHASMRGYRLHWKQVTGQPDVTFISKKVAIFVNGCYWNRCHHCQLHDPKTNQEFWNRKFKANVERGAKKNVMLREEGWRVLTIWECQIKAELKICVSKVKNAIN